MKLSWVAWKNYLSVSKRLYSVSRVGADKRTEWTEPSGFDTGLTIYNTACKRKVKFKTKIKDVVSWYACGPTVYDSAHIGHACCYVYQDIVRRILEDVYRLNVVMVMGITDIDDKIIAAANLQGKDVTAVAKHYEKEFFTDLSNLNVRMPTIAARVTDYIPSIITFIETILKKGFAYSTPDGSVYFRVDKYGAYGKLHPAEGEANESDEAHNKESRRDFALWKGAKQGEPYWIAPWGKGRPGWHIECSTIASCLLGQEIDLHSGGVDLVFPHHENEEAQSCCHHGVNQWVNYWLHTGHLRLAGDVKMSKSLKNTVSISQFLKNFSSFELRMFCLLTRYRNGIEFSDQMMENAVSVCRKIDHFLNDCDNFFRDARQFEAIDEPLLLKCLSETQVSVNDALSKDFDTPRAISHLLHLVSVINKMLHQPSPLSDNIQRPVFGLAAAANYIRDLLKTFGCFSDQQEAKPSEFDELLNDSVNFRANVRKAVLKIKKDHPKESIELKKEILNYCDDYRKTLLTDGVELKDHGEKTSWNIVRKV